MIENAILIYITRGLNAISERAFGSRNILLLISKYTYYLIPCLIVISQHLAIFCVYWYTL